MDDISAMDLQAPGTLSITTPLGPNALLPIAVGAEEAISEPYLVITDMVSPERRLGMDALLHAPVCVTVRRPDWPERHFHGVVRRFVATGPASEGVWGYRAEIVPKLWFLSQTEDCRIFQAASAASVIETILREGGVDHFDIRLFGDQTVREHTAQFNESALAFITRLMEEEGWFYFFEHAETSHTLIVSDANTVFRPTSRPRLDIRHDAQGGPDCLLSWQPVRATTHGVVKGSDYDPAAPAKTLDATQATRVRGAGAGTREQFHWPALTTDPARLAARMRQGMEAAEVAVSLFEGTASHPGLMPGGRFTVVSDVSGTPRDYVARSVVHQASDERPIHAGAPTYYRNSLTAFPAALPWRQPMTTPRPRMEGIHSGVVIGPEGEEVYADRLGRVKVRLRWDHRGSATAAGSCWVRVVQPWAGPGWGWQGLPRVGTEVAVAFMDGDCDRPVVVGALYNGNDLPPFPPPAGRTRTGLRTRSVPRGGKAEFNEFSFEDKRGEEEVKLRAQRDLRVEAGNDAVLMVHNCRVKKVRGSETSEVGQDRRTTVGGSDSLRVRGGDCVVTAEAGAVRVQAADAIELQVGGNLLRVDHSGVTISATLVKVAGRALVEVDSPMTEVKADGMLTLKGGVVLLN